MSDKPYPVRSSHSSRRYSPYPRSSSPSNLPSNRRHPPSSGNSDHLSPASTNCQYSTPYPSTNPVPPPAHPSPHSTYQDGSDVTQHSFPQSSHPSPPPTMNNSYPYPMMSETTHPPPSSQPLITSSPSVWINHPEDTIYHNYSNQQQLTQLSQGQTSSSERPRSQDMFSGSHTIPMSPRQLPPSQCSHLLENDTGRPYLPVPHVENRLLGAPAPHHQSISNSYMHSATYSIPQGESLTVQGPSYLPYPAQGPFSHAQNFVVKDSVFIDNNTPTENFMKDFLQHTIIGAEFDSSARDPPPRCHPGTRLEIIGRCLNFILECHGEEKLRWVVGPAGVGKSAVMQMVVEKTPDGIIFASVFLSVNGRRDGTKTITTVAYQLAVKSERYYQFLRNEIARDPSLLQKSLSVHFTRFIVEPFIRRRLFNPSDRFLIAIDGLDECDSPLVQQNLLELISDFCITYPTSPIAWIVASRPEPHITSFFDRAEVEPAYTKEEMEVDSDEARDDVQRFLRAELKKIKDAYPTLKHKREWPSEHEFTKIAAAAGGLFAYAATVVRFIGDPYYRNPTVQLRLVLEVIDGSQVHKSGKSHPMAQLDALYARILSNVSTDVMVDTKKLLLLTSSNALLLALKFRQLCNLVGLTDDAAYAAICHLHAVVRVPEPHKADDERLEYFHKSFGDFLLDFRRSGFSPNIYNEAEQLMVESSLKIVEQFSDDSHGVTSDEGIECYGRGHLKGGPGVCDNISLSWPGDDHFQMTNDELRLNLGRHSMNIICIKFSANNPSPWRMSCFHVLATRFAVLGRGFPLRTIRGSIFGQLCHELAELGQFKQVPLRTLDYAAICGDIELRFIGPIGMDVEVSDPWNSSCHHQKQDLENLQQGPAWSTLIPRFVPDTAHDVAGEGIPRFNLVIRNKTHRDAFGAFPKHGCDHCLRRFARHFIDNPDQPANIFVDSTEMCYVEFSFVDPNDGVSKWSYQFCHSGLPILVNV